VNRVTLDSNVYLSGFVFGGKPKRVLEMAIDGEIEVAVSDPIIQEVRRHLLGKFGVVGTARGGGHHRSSARLAHYGVDSGTAGLSYGCVRDAIAFTINMGTPPSSGSTFSGRIRVTK
jgi:hypothetical protein